jgi:hypothetical protein
LHLLPNWRVLPVFEHLTQIAHVEPSLAAGTFDKVIGFTLRDIFAPQAVDQGCPLNRTRRDERFVCLSLDLLGFHGG